MSGCQYARGYRITGLKIGVQSMKKKNYYGYKKASIATALLCLFLLFYTASDVRAENKTIIRVGYVEQTGFMENVAGEYSGYCVDYLEEIAAYTNWEYEYVADTWENCLVRLEEGELDLLCMAHKNLESTGKYTFTELPIGYEYTTVYAKQDSDIYYEDYEAMENSKVGLLRGGFHADEFLKVADEKNLNVEKIYFDTEDAIMEALEAEEVDLAVVCSLHCYQDAKIVGQYWATPFYCIMGRESEAYMNDMDAALQRLKIENPGFELELQQKYYDDSKISSTPLFTREEHEYIENVGSIKVKLMEGSIPLSYMEDGEEAGVFVEYLKLLEKVSGLEIEIEMSSTPLTMEEQTGQIKENEYLMLRSQRVLECNGLDEGLITTNPLLETELSYIVKKGHNLSREQKNFVYAVTNEMGYLVPILLEESKDYEIKYYDNALECLEAVRCKEADIAIQDSYVLSYLMQKPKYEDQLIECPGGNFYNGMCLIASEDQELLVQVLNKSIKFISAEDEDRLVKQELLTKTYEYEASDVIYDYWEVILVILLGIVIAIVVYTILMRYMTNLRIRKSEYELLQKKVQTDELTKVLYNRSYFYKKAREMINEAVENMYIVIMDVANFKVVNDLYGIGNGNKLLIYMAHELVKMTEGKNVLLSRFDDDHFYLCLSESDFKDLNFPRKVKTFLKDIDVTVSYGVFSIEDQKDLAVNIMCDRANIAVHDKERKQLEYIRYYNEEERARLIHEREIENDMERAIKEHQFCVYVQPKYDIDKEKIIGGEALVRWKHPQKGMIPPGDFISIFEKNGFIVELDYFVWEETCRLIFDMKKKNIFCGPISINVSRVHFYGQDLKEKLISLIEEYQLLPSDLELEITETICAEDPDIIYSRIRELQQVGFKVAMDDFGSGYSSLNMLKEMPLDVIKMDLRFLDGGDNEEKSRYILRTLIALAQNMNLLVVVEGVESAEQVEFLRRIGRCFVQGYYYSKPVDCKAFVKMLQK